MARYNDKHKQVMDFLIYNNFHYSKKWALECIDYFIKTEPNISISALQDKVCQQWLFLNLRDLKIPSLPPNLASQPIIILPGKYVVQVETMWDCGRAMYSTWQEIRKQSTENIMATNKHVDIPIHRCLRMTISDGVQELSAMEYSPIQSLQLGSSDLPPGFKMLIIGPAVCRRGMLLLKCENVKILGGEVDIFAESHNLSRIVGKRLDLDVTQLAQPLCLSDPTEENNARESDFLNDHVDEFLMDIDIPNLLTKLPEEIAQNPRECSSEHGEEVNDKFPQKNKSYEDYPSEKNGSGSYSDPNSSSFIANKSTESAIIELQRLPCLKLSKEPFIYLAQTLEASFEGEYKVKAIILTLKTRISNKDDRFHLQAQICDGTLSVDVMFCSEILEHMLGFSPCEELVLKREKSKNIALAEKLKLAFVSTQQKLISLNSIMTICFFKNKAMPLVVLLEEPTDDHLMRMIHRKIC